MTDARGGQVSTSGRAFLSGPPPRKVGCVQSHGSSPEQSNVPRRARAIKLGAVTGTGFVLASIACAAGCAALAPMAVKWGADLISAASQNYSQQYSRQVEGLVLAMYSDQAARRLHGRTDGGNPQVGSGSYGAPPSYPSPAQGSPYPQGQPGYPPDYGNPQVSQGGYGAPPNYPSPAQGSPYPQGQSGYPSAGGQQPQYGGPQAGQGGYGAPPNDPYAGQTNPYSQGQSAYPSYPSAGSQSTYGSPQAGPGGYPAYGDAGAGQFAPSGGVQTGYPAAGQPGQYPGPPYGQGGQGSSMPPIVLDAAILAQRASDRAARRSDPAPIQDGETLRDGGSDPRKGDVVKFSFRTNCDCYVYVIGADATGYIARVFPDPGSRQSNPVRANQQYVVPEGTAWYGLDQHKGVEQVFFITSRGPRQDIENPLNQLARTARSTLSKSFRAVREAAMPAQVMRGLVKVQMGAESTVQSE